MNEPPIQYSQQYEGIIGWILQLMEILGEVGVGVGVLIETVIPPIPSEATLLTAGFLAFDGRMSFWLAVTLATVGSLIGAWAWYSIGAALGRTRTRNLIGAVPLMEYKDFDRAEAFFNRFGVIAVLGGRLVPLVRSFVSVPAGIERMPLWQFSVYTFVGAFISNTIWVALGYWFGPAIQPILERWSKLLSYAIVVAILALIIGFFGTRYVKKVRESRQSA